MIVNQANPDPFPAFSRQQLGQAPAGLIIPENIEIQADESLGLVHGPENFLEGQGAIFQYLNGVPGEERSFPDAFQCFAKKLIFQFLSWIGREDALVISIRDGQLDSNIKQIIDHGLRKVKSRLLIEIINHGLYLFLFHPTGF
jgi:hypothetical protein